MNQAGEKMHHILIVDDEFAARETLKCIIDWEKAGFAPPVCARNGKQALELYSQTPFDIVMTDIEMPVMNGLELIEEIKKRNHTQKIVVVSCHEKFEYARRAMQLGIEDYLIKDLINSEELYFQIVNMTAQMNEDLDNQAQAQKEKANRIVERMLAYGTVTEEERAALNSLLKVEHGYLLVGLNVVVDSYGKHRYADDREEWGRKVDRFRSALEAKTMALAAITHDSFFVLTKLVDDFSLLNFYTNVIQYANRIRKLAKSVGIPSVSIGISNQSPSLDDLRTLHHQAERACSMRVVLGLNKNIIYNAIDTSCKAFDKELLEQRMRDLKVLLNDNDLEALQQVEKLYIPDLMDGFMEANYFRYVNNRLYGLAMGYLYQNNLSVGEVLENGQISLERIEALETASEMSGYFSRLFGELLRHEAETAGAQGDLTERVKRYVEQNYDKEITLSDIADTVHVHKGYLCRAFKEKTGENLMQYVVAKKIEKAKEMLEDQSLKLYEISNALSFATPQYFSMVFKKQTGMTPNEYKKSLAAK